MCHALYSSSPEHFCEVALHHVPKNEAIENLQKLCQILTDFKNSFFIAKFR